jgi:hypothetical protein
MIADQWRMPMAVLGLVLCTLLASAFLKHYQEYKSYQRARVRRIANTLKMVEQALAELKVIPLSQPLRTALRGEVYKRYKLLGKLHRRYPDIERRVNEARSRLNGEGAGTASSVPPIEDEQQFRRLIGAFDGLTGYLQTAGSANSLSAEQRRAFAYELRERRAEVAARFHIVQAHRLRERGDMRRARQHLHTLMITLHRRGPNNDFVRALYHEATELHTAFVLEGRGGDSATSGGDQRSNRSSAA